MHDDALAPYREALRDRALPDGSFAVAAGSGARPDATAWAAVALHVLGEAALAARARTALAGLQRPDGAVPVLPERPEAAWPTALAILAWLPDPALRSRAEAAASWLLAHPGRHWPKEQQPSIFGHDPSIKGWPWIDGTHSWVEPTAQVMLSLVALGQAGAPQVAEAARMLLDRQLPSGGWNYGNTRVFKNILLPIPECTGLALTALAAVPARPDKASLAASLAYLAGPECAVATPLAATWRAFGLAAWEAAPEGTLDLLGRCLERQSRYGPYDTPLLAQLLAALASGGRFAALTRQGA